MPDLLTTDEAADYLRLWNANSTPWSPTVPCPAPRSREVAVSQGGARPLDRGRISRAGHAPPAAAPPIVGGSHDPLLEWALRESGSRARQPCRKAARPAWAGSRAARWRLAAIHLHRLDGDDATANIEAVDAVPGLHDAVLIAFARRDQGLLVAPGNPLGLSDMASLARDARGSLCVRPALARNSCCSRLLARAGLALDALEAIDGSVRPAPISARRSVAAAPIAALRAYPWPMRWDSLSCP